MPLLREEAEKLSNNVLEQGVVEEIIDKDAMLGLMPFMKIMGKAYVYDRESTLSEGEFLDPNEEIEEGGATFDEVIAKLRILGGMVDVDNFIDETMADTNDQTAIQIAAKAKGITRKFHRTMAIGDSAKNRKEFDGLPQLVSDDQTFFAGANGSAGALTFEHLDKLLRAIPLGADAFILRGGTVDAVAAMLRQLGGTQPADVLIPMGGDKTLAVPSYRGVPFIVNDFLSGSEVANGSGATCSIYAARFNEADGVHGIYGGQSAGVRIRAIGPVQNKDAERYRLMWYTGTALKSTRSLARLAGITNI